MDKQILMDWLMRQQIDAGDRALIDHRNGDNVLFQYNLGMAAAFRLVIDQLEKEKAAKQ